MTQRAMGASVQFPLKMLLVWFYTWLLFAKQGYPFIFPDKGHIVPSIRGAVYYVGENITLHCYSKTTLTAGKFTFAADVDVPSQYITTINDTYIRMDKPADATDYLSTIYNCVDLVNNKVNIIGSQSVYTEYRPQNVTDILCVHFNTHDLNCSWNLGPYPYKMEPVITSPTRYLTSVKPQWGVDDQIWNECSYSSINSCTIENYNNVFVFLRVNVTNVSRRDSAISIFRVDHYVVPPTSVSNLTLKGLNSTCAVLFWRPSDNATGVKYSISYGSDEISDNRINIETASENITVCELVPFSKYTFTVQAFSNNFSSQPTTGVLIAAQDLLENVTSVTNVTCIYYDRLHVICTWSLHSDPSGQLPTKPSEVRHLTSIMPQWSVDEKTWNPCSFTTLTSCTIKNFINLWVSFRVNVTNSLSHESSVTVLPFLSINDFVKPAPVSKLTVRRLNASCALLTWSLNIAGLTYSISNSSDVINYENEVNTTGDNTTICNLSLFKKHTFRVQAFPQKGFPSEPVTAILNEQDGLSSEEVSGTYYIGEKITLHCHSFENFTRGTFIYGSDIEVPSNFVTIVNATYIRLDMPVDKPILPTFYYCLDKKDNSTTFVGLEQIHTEYRPQNVTNVTCIYLNKRNVSCSWSLGPNIYKHPAVSDSHSSYLTSVTPHWSSDKQQWKSCINTSLTSCDIGRYNNLLVSLRVNVTNISRRESAVIEISDLRVNDFVKPLPVENMAVTSLSSTCASLSWNGKMARLSYSVSYSSHHFPDDGNNFTTQNQGITVCRLHPFRNYTFQVRAFPEKGFPSEPSTQLLQTEEDVPASGPVLTNGSYYRAPCSPKENKEQIYIYFQPIKEEDRNGNITSYLAEVSVDGQSNASDYISQDFFFNFYVACNQRFNASIYGRTKVGFSPPAKLYVPSRMLVKDLYNEKELDLKVMEMDPGVVMATWNVLDVRPFQMVIYYCKEGHSLRTCNGPMNYIVTNVMAGQHRWDSGEANLFGVAIITANNVSSGIHFTDCIYNPKVSEVSAPKEPVITKNPNFVLLSWNYDRCSRDKKIFTYSYQIRLCALLEPPSCKIYEAQGGDTTKYDLYNLTPQVNYSVFILANTTSGLSHQSAPAFFMLDPVGDQNTVETTTSAAEVTTSHGHHDITCTESRMEFSIPLSSPHTSETATLSDPNCPINVTRTHVRGGVDLNSCGTTVQFQNDSVIFRNAIIFSAPESSSLGSSGSNGSVSQYQDIIPIQCVYNRIATVHLSYMPVVRRVLFTESGVGQFSFNIQQFWDASFTNMVSDGAYPLRMELDADVFIQLSVGSEGQPVAGHKEIGMEVQQCLVSPSSSVIEAQLHYYPLIQDGCPASSDVHIIPNTNASDSTVMRFRFRAVNFFDPSSSSSSSLVFVHCRMGLCLTGSCKPSAWSCLTPPARRVRRDVDQSKRAAHQLSTGPFLIMADEASTSSSSTTATVMAVVSTSVATVAIVIAAIALIALRRRRTTERN